MAVRHSSGMTLIELVVVLAIVGIMVQTASWGLGAWSEGQRPKTTARSIADALNLGRGEAIRTGNSHLVVFQQVLGATADIEIVDDGVPAAANCTVNAGETVHQKSLELGVNWGTASATAAAPDDPGLAVANIVNGASFTDATRVATNVAYAVMFLPDGLPRLFTQNAGACAAIGLPAQGGGAIYVSNGRRDYAVVLSQLGVARVHSWDTAASAWRG